MKACTRKNVEDFEVAKKKSKREIEQDRKLQRKTVLEKDFDLRKREKKEMNFKKMQLGMIFKKKWTKILKKGKNWKKNGEKQKKKKRKNVLCDEVS